MKAQAVLLKIKEIMADIHGPEITLETSYMNDIKFSKRMILLYYLEKDFDINIREEHIHTIGDLCVYLEK